MAEVWVARKALGRKGSKFVAIKLIVDHYVGEERYTRMFRAEAELAAVLSHANIVQVFDEGEDAGRSYLIMEWVDGLNLLKLGDMLALLDDEQRRFRIIAYIIGQLLHALHYAHSITSADGHPLGVVHRDVSPQNVLVSNHGEVKLTDFGVAYYNIEESSGIHVKGKVRYMSPEQLGGKTRSATVDLYAVGALLHELLDGKKFRGEYDDGQELFSVVMSGFVPPVSRPVPPELDRLRLGLLEPDAARRLQTAEQAIVLLKRYPDYGDARDELTKLCGSLTGVVKPRVGPGQSSQHPAAEQATTRWGGHQPLAKPKVEVGRPPLPPPPPRPRPARPLGAALHGVASEEEIVEVSAVITGETQMVPRGELLPTTPMRVSNLRELASERQSTEPSNGAPTPGPPIALAVPMGHVQGYAEPFGRPGPSAVYVPEQAAGPYGMAPANGAAAYGQGQALQPMQGQPGVGWVDPNNGIPPTHRLSVAEAMGFATQGYGMRTTDAGTDHDIVPTAVAGDGSDTRHDVRAGMARRTSAVSIVMPRQSAMAAIGVGLVLVAMMSVVVTWSLFSGGAGDETTTGTEPLAESATKSKDAELEPDRAEMKQKRAEEAGEGPQLVERGQLVLDEGEAGGEVGDEAAGVPGTEEEAAEDVPEAEDVPAEDEQTPRAADPEPSVEAPPVPVPEKKKAKPKAYVKIAGSSGSDKPEVRLGSQTFKVNAAVEHKIASGMRSIKWRKMPGEPWQSAGSWDFRPGKHFVVFVSKKGPTVRNST